MTDHKAVVILGAAAAPKEVQLFMSTSSGDLAHLAHFGVLRIREDVARMYCMLVDYGYTRHSVLRLSDVITDAIKHAGLGITGRLVVPLYHGDSPVVHRPQPPRTPTPAVAQQEVEHILVGA